MSADAVPIFSGPDGRAEDFWVPGFELRDRGQKLPVTVARDVSQLAYKDDLEKIDQVDLTLSNWDDEAYTFSWSERDRFLPGKELEIWLGYLGPDRLRRVISAEITSFKPSFPASGQPSIVVSGLNVLHRLRRTKHTQIFENKTPTQIAERIGRQMNVKLITQPKGEEPYDYLMQDGYDINFLLQLARTSGYEIYVDEGRSTKDRPAVFFGSTDEVRKITYKLRYGATLIDFQPTITTTRQVASVTVRSWDRTKKKPISVTYSRKQLNLGPIDTDVESAFNERVEVVTAVVANEAEARRMARDRLRDIAHDTVTASGSTVGLPDLRAGSTIEVDGVGKRFSGKYFVTSTTHTLGSAGYTTSFNARRQ